MGRARLAPCCVLLAMGPWVASAAPLAAGGGRSPGPAGDGMRQPLVQQAKRLPGADSRSLPPATMKVRSDSRAWFTVESGPVRFGDLVPGEATERPGAIRVRVHSAGPWTLELVLDVPLQIVDRGGIPVPQSRIAWRSRQSGGYAGFSGARAATIARGGATGPFGEEVVVDLRMQLDDNDELGRYETAFNLILEGR